MVRLLILLVVLLTTPIAAQAPALTLSLERVGAPRGLLTRDLMTALRHQLAMHVTITTVANVPTYRVRVMNLVVSDGEAVTVFITDHRGVLLDAFVWHLTVPTLASRAEAIVRELRAVMNAAH